MAAGAGDILQLIRSGEAVTRAEVHEATGLSRVTVAQRIDALLESGVIREAGIGEATGGRRARRLVFDPARSLVLAASLDTEEATLAIIDAHGEIRARMTVDVRVDVGPATVLDTVLNELTNLLAKSATPVSEVGAVAIAVPGPVDPITHRLFEPPTMPGWSGWPIIETVRDRFDVPVYIENDTDAMAYGEFVELGEASSRPFVLVKASNFLGAGLVLDGRIYRGFDGGAGAIGHVQVGGDALCRCGRHGCLAAEASGAAITRRLADIGRADTASIDLNTLVMRDDPAAIAEISRAGTLIGQVLATVVGIVNPATIVIEGTLVCPQLIASIRSAVYEGSLPRATRQLDIRPGNLAADAALIGLARVAIDDLFSPANVNRVST